MNNCLYWNTPLSPLQGECRSAVLSQGIALLSPGLYSLGPLARWNRATSIPSFADGNGAEFIWAVGPMESAKSIGSFADGNGLNSLGSLARSNGRTLEILNTLK
jgi:hypothetical protein